MLIPLLSLVLVLGLLPFSIAQSSTLTSPPSTGSAASTRSGTHSANATTSSPANATVTLSANGTATATIVNGTAVNATSTPTSTSTSASAFPTLGNASPCVVGCFQNSVSQANCSSITDEACFCSSATFRNATVNCVSTQCPTELSGAESLAQQFCNMVSVTLTFPSPTVSGSATITGSQTTTGSSTSAPSTAGNSGAIEFGRPAALAALSGLAGLSWIILGW